MIVNRFVTKYKPGKFEEAVALLTTEAKRLVEKSGYGELRSARLLIPTDREDTIIGEYAFDDSAQKEDFWASWHEDPEVASFLEKHSTMYDGEMAGTNYEILVYDEFKKDD